jgi:hypothetical protein
VTYLTILIIIWISIIVLFQFNCDLIYSAIIRVSDVSDDPTPIEFSRAEYSASADHSTLFRRNFQNLRYL